MAPLTFWYVRHWEKGGSSSLNCQTWDCGRLLEYVCDSYPCFNDVVSGFNVSGIPPSTTPGFFRRGITPRRAPMEDVSHGVPRPPNTKMGSWCESFLYELNLVITLFKVEFLLHFVFSFHASYHHKYIILKEFYGIGVARSLRKDSSRKKSRKKMYAGLFTKDIPEKSVTQNLRSVPTPQMLAGSHGQLTKHGKAKQSSAAEGKARRTPAGHRPAGKA